jgi:hypothetical protein
VIAVVPVNKRRGKARNNKLDSRLKKHGGPISLEFDRDVTYLPVGELNDLFTREVGIYMWRNIAFDKRSWDNVDPEERNAMMEHLGVNFFLCFIYSVFSILYVVNSFTMFQCTE